MQRFLCLAIAIGLAWTLGTQAVRAQPAGPPAYARAAEVSDLLPRGAAPALSAQQTVALSRLLATPGDQAAWLQTRVDTLQKNPGAARDLARAARQRIGTWQTRGIDLAVAAANLDRLIATLAPLVEITDPAALLARIASMSAAELTGLSASDKFVLHARGVPEARLAFSAEGPEAWTRRTAALLTSVDALPGPATLLPLAASAPPVAPGATPPAIAQTTVAALLARALGLDGFDRGEPRDGQGRMRADEPVYWADLATALERADLWRWAALARIVQAATASDPATRGQATTLAAQQWQRLRSVDSGTGASWHAVDGWLERLSDPARLNADGAIPLSADFRAAARAARSQYEQHFLAARAANNDGDSFRAMQLAKAADAGFPTDRLEALPTATIDDLKATFGIRRGDALIPNIHLYLEHLAIASPNGVQHYGLALSCETASLGTDDKYVTGWIGPRPSVDDVVREGLSQIKTRTTTAKFLVALDSAGLGPEWFASGHGEALLLDSVRAGEDSWLIYAPSAAAFKPGSGWTADALARVWYRGALRAGQPQLGVLVRRDPGRPDALRTVDSPVLRTSIELCPLYVGGAFPAALQRPPAAGGWPAYLKTMLSSKSTTARNSVAVVIPKT